MDDKSINLWRQIEGFRRAKTIEHGQRGALTERKSRGRGKGAAPLASTAANDPAWTPREFKFR